MNGPEGTRHRGELLRLVELGELVPREDLVVDGGQLDE